MQRDFKIGLAVGVVSVTAAMVWLCAQPKLGAETRALRTASTPSPKSVEIDKPPEEIQALKNETAFAEAPADKHRTTTKQPPTVNTEQAVRIHIVQKGDTLSAISEKYYGSARFWQKIMAANGDILEDPDLLFPGTRLVIPEL